eukprot:3322181-Pyramimonas_sp.AAC.1
MQGVARDAVVHHQRPFAQARGVVTWRVHQCPPLDGVSHFYGACARELRHLKSAIEAHAASGHAV